MALPENAVLERSVNIHTICFGGEGPLKSSHICQHRNGKNCNHSHSREEILYHPSVYKTSMCDTWNCSRYYCPFAHSMDELVGKQLVQPSFGVPHIDPVAEDQRLRQLNLEDFWEDNDFEDVVCSSVGVEFSELASLQMRRVVHRTACGGAPLITTTSLESSRMGGSCLQSLTSSLPNNGASNPDPGWITLTQGLRVELVVRGISPLTGAELCLGTVRAPWETGAASASGSSQHRRGQQQASMVVKVIPITSETDPEAILALTNQLQTIARSEHKNIISVKKVHLVRFPSGNGSALAVAYERCSTSLYSTIAEGYRLRSGGNCFPRGLAGRMSSTGRQFTATSAAVGKISEFLSAVQRFHSLGMTHTRICPSNIFIDADANLKLGDFDSKLGLGLMVKKNDNNFLTESVACWIDPEVISDEKEKKVDWKRGDVFATGLCVFLALTGQHPFGTFLDEDRTAAAGAAANFRPGPAASQFVEGTEKVLENMRTLNCVNQHLLYGTPLLLDLVMRMLVSRTEVSDLLSHPLFWDFYSIARFITRLDDTSPVIKSVCETCPVPWTGCVTQEEWKLVLGSPSGGIKSPIDFKDTVLDLLRAIRQALGRHKASGCELCSCSAVAEAVDQSSCGNQHHLISIFVTRMVSRFPAVVVRAWDASRIPTACGSAELEAFRRNHLSWMTSRPRQVAQLDGSGEMLPSHAFVREYYVVVKALVGAQDMILLGRDESPEILASILAMVEGTRSSENNNNGVSVDPSILSSMLNSFGSMMRSDMLPPNVPKSFVVSLIEAAGGSPSVTPSPSSGVYYSTVTSLHLPSGATTAASSPVFAPVVAVASPRKGSPMSSSVGRHRRMSSCDGWEYAVACPPTMMDLGPRNGPHSLSALEGEEDESPPPGFQTVWQSMAEDGL